MLREIIEGILGCYLETVGRISEGFQVGCLRKCVIKCLVEFLKESVDDLWKKIAGTFSEGFHEGVSESKVQVIKKNSL